MGYIDDTGNYYEGDRRSFGHLVVSTRPSPAHAWSNDQWQLDYVQVKTQALIDINNAAGAARARYITVSIGQEATYILKEQQARKFKAAGYPAGAVPVMVQAEMDAFGITATEATDIVIATADQWISLAATIEKIRRQGSAQIDAAVSNLDDAAAVEAIKDEAVNALDVI